MNNTISISERKIQNELDRLLENMGEEFEAMITRHSAQGILRSGNTIKQAMILVEDKSKTLRDVVIKESKWAVGESIYVPVSIANELTVINDNFFHLFTDESRPYIKKATEMSGRPELFDEVYPNVEKSVNRCSGEAKLEIEAIIASNRSRGIKGAAKFIYSGLSKLWGA